MTDHGIISLCRRYLKTAFAHLRGNQHLQGMTGSVFRSSNLIVHFPKCNMKKQNNFAYEKIAEWYL